MGNLLETATRYFDEEKWPCVRHPSLPILQMGFQGDNGQWNCFAHVNEEDNRFSFYSVCPVSAPEHKRSALAEFITRANTGLAIGNFELDFEDGEIRYKTSIDVEGDRLSGALIRQLVYANIATLDSYLPGIMKLIYADVSPVQAIAQVEPQV